MYYLGVDIGGTKSVSVFGSISKGEAKVLKKGPIRTTADYSWKALLSALAEDFSPFIKDIPKEEIGGLGISCGGPLDSRQGVILSPPNLIGWDNVPVVDFFEKELGVSAWLCNDANACALAEWKFGAGKGKNLENVVFLTFGTGLGAGLILNGKLYSGTNDMAGETGHIRLENYGPTGYGKSGSFEGFCSGGGIAQLAKLMVLEELQQGKTPDLCSSLEDIPSLTAKKVGLFAQAGDPLALHILEIVGNQLGKGLSIIIDLLNPEMIIIGSIFTRAYREIWPSANAVIQKEALSLNQKVCTVNPSLLGEELGDIAALTTAYYYSNI